jgi:hypothetical protein
VFLIVEAILQEEHIIAGIAYDKNIIKVYNYLK